MIPPLPFPINKIVIFNRPPPILARRRGARQTRPAPNPFQGPGLMNPFLPNAPAGANPVANWVGNPFGFRSQPYAPVYGPALYKYPHFVGNQNAPLVKIPRVT